MPDEDHGRSGHRRAAGIPGPQAVVRKEADTRAIELDPCTRLCFIEVEEPDMHKPSSDLERVYKALLDQWQIDNVA
jgi:uncharacterized 2Fe-2S/4Fe-4S cluster protein (DUF4445 family)